MSNSSSCSTGANKKKMPKIEKLGTSSMNEIKHIIGVMSGKGGVGKSTVAANLALSLQEQGYKVGIMDADVTGPSIPRILGIQDKRARMYPEGLRAVEADNGLKAMSLNLLIEEEDRPVIWRGPIITSTIKQFYQEVIWEKLDYLIIDMPPGTGDVTLTVMQSFPLDGVVMVAVPQDMVSMIVAKAINMSRQLGVHVFGVVENMSYMTCPSCDEKIHIFEHEGIDDFLKEQKVELLAELPIKGEMVQLSKADDATRKLFKDLSGKLLNQLK